METFYFSFGQSHVHRHNGKTFDCDVLAKVIAEDSNTARDKIFDAFGPKWAMQYDEDAVDFKYFPRGSLDL